MRRYWSCSDTPDNDPLVFLIAFLVSNGGSEDLAKKKTKTLVLQFLKNGKKKMFLCHVVYKRSFAL